MSTQLNLRQAAKELIAMKHEPQIRYPSRIFEHPNTHGGFQCPVCKSGADAPVVLAPIPGTERDNLVECKQVHAKCWEVVDLMQQIEETQN